MSSSTSFGAALTAVGAAGIIALAPYAHALPGSPFPLAPTDCDWIIFDTDSVIKQDNGIQVHVAWGSPGSGTGSYTSNGVDWEGPVHGGVVKGTNTVDFTINFAAASVAFDSHPAPAPTNHYTGTIDQNGSASGTTTNNSGASNGWTIDGGFKCIGRAPAPQPQAAPAPSQEPVPPPVEKPPTDAVRMVITRGITNVTVNISSTANIAGQCTYNATEVNGLGPSVNRTFDLAPRGNTQLTFLAPLIGQTYHVVLSCRGAFNGQDVEFGHAEQDV